MSTKTIQHAIELGMRHDEQWYRKILSMSRTMAAREILILREPGLTLVFLVMEVGTVVEVADVGTKELAYMTVHIPNANEENVVFLSLAAEKQEAQLLAHGWERISCPS